MYTLTEGAKQYTIHIKIILNAHKGCTVNKIYFNKIIL